MDILGAEDLDKSFSYYTKQQVNIQDRWLGLTNLALQITIILYIVIGIFWLDEGYLQFETARGSAAVEVRGDAASTSSRKPGVRYFSAEEITYPGLENGNVFVATRQDVHRQMRGTCEDKNMPCATDWDCSIFVKGKCTENRLCEEPSWCDVDDAPEAYTLEVADFFVWVKSSIQFVKLAPEKVYTTEDHHPYPERGHNAFSVRDLLMACKPAPVRYEEVSELGATIEVMFTWDCNVENSCKPSVSARRVDTLFDPTNIGYRFNYPEYVGKDERLLNKMRGIRIYFRTVGRGRKLSLVALITKLSTAGALLKLAPIIADLLMLNVFHLKKRYFARKYQESPDFSLFLAKLKQREEESKSLPSKREEEDTSVRESEWRRRLDEED